MNMIPSNETPKELIPEVILGTSDTPVTMENIISAINASKESVVIGFDKLAPISTYWNQVYLRFLKFYSYSTDPPVRAYGNMWHHYESGAGAKNFRGCPWNEDVYTFDLTSV